MADYQSLLTRAVANLPSSSPAAARQAIYDRARKALLTQLRTLRPPLPESDITREENALNQAIAQVEAKFGGTDAAQAEPTPSKTAPSAPGQPAVERPAPPRPAPGSQPPVSASAPAPKPQAAPTGPAPAAPAQATPVPPAAPARAATPAVSPPRPAGAQPPPRPEPARAPALAGAQQGAPVAPVRPAQAPAASGAVNLPESRAFQGAAATKAPPLRADRAPQPGETSGAAAPLVTARTEGPGPASSNLAKVVPSAESPAGGSSAPPVVARVENGAEPGSAPDAPIAEDRLSTAPRLDPEGQRPQAPTADVERSRSWLWLALAVVLGVVLSVAGAAIVMRQKPQDLAIAPPEPQQEAQSQPPSKIAQRAQPSPTEDNSAAPAASEPQGGQPQNGQAPANPAAEADNTSLPSAARAAMLIASPDNPQKPVVNLGSAVWSTIPPAPGQPATVAVKADADIPDLKMHATMTLRKNTDPTLQATHTIDLKFTFADGAPIAGFKDVGAPQMRKVDSTASEALTSVKVKVSDVYFLIALAKGDPDTARNLDLMQTRAWFDFPLLLNDNRIAKLVFQKSSDGEAMLAKAFDAWK